MWASPPTEGLSRVRAYNVSPSVMAKGHDTSLAEGGRDADLHVRTQKRTAGAVLFYMISLMRYRRAKWAG